MVRAWIIFGTLVLGVLFKWWPDYGDGMIGFKFSATELNKQSWIYFTMEHLNAIAIGVCLLIKDKTPIYLFITFVGILIIDMAHYILFFRDEGVGFNLIKVVIFGAALFWEEIKLLFIRIKEWTR